MTQKQQRALENLVADSSNLSKAMIDAGYSPRTARAPQKLTESKGFQELKKQYQDALIASGIDHNKLVKKMAEWIDAVKISSSLTEPDRVVPDYQTQIKAGEMLREDFGLKDKQGVQIQNLGEMDIQFFTDEQSQVT